MAFQPGVSGNPNGRPVGTGSRQQLMRALIEPHKEKIIKKILDLALEGNVPMLTILAERLLPAKPKDEPIVIDIPEAQPDPEALKENPYAISYYKTIKNINSDGIESLTSNILSNLHLNIVRSVVQGKLSPVEAEKIVTIIDKCKLKRCHIRLWFN